MLFEKLKFLPPQDLLSLRFWSNFGPIYPMKESDIKKIKYIWGKKIYPSRYPNIQKSEPYLVPILN